MGQGQSIQSHPHSARSYHYNNTTKNKNSQRIEHQGILKVRSTPFPNCVQISNDGLTLFLENAQTTLSQLLESRLYTNRLFPVQDVQKLIENIIYTLAFLSQSHISYLDLNPENIYYSNGQFKLLPNQLIQQSFYQKAWQRFYGLRTGENEEDLPITFLSPELIIALRMKQKKVNDSQIINKSNIFIFGLILLETTTLMPSSQCFDPSNYDIFNNIISQRLELVQAHYNEDITRIIANMLDYDFNQRMDLKDLSIWVNRQLVENRQAIPKTYNTEQKQYSIQNKSISIQKSCIIPNESLKNINVKQINQIAQQQQIPPARSYSRSNMVYINGYDDGTKNDDPYLQHPRGGSKNSVYLGNTPFYQANYQINKKMEQKQSTTNLNTQKETKQSLASNINEQRFNKYDVIHTDHRQRNNKLNQQKYDNLYQQKRKPLNYGAQNIQLINYNPPQQTTCSQLSKLKSRLYSGSEPFRKLENNIEQISGSKVKTQNKFYPSLKQVQNSYQFSDATKRLAKHSQVGGGRNSQLKQTYDSKQSRQSDGKSSVNDGSINRIKMQIQKSRKLIEQFRKCQGISS